ncbi:MAG: UDP-N-acetylglucosamine 1-carboxyvinyltransferase, partial [Planctomycetota bacterium]|nr:UDP-N-acetylglucosamine 1-carboxyvinyltransferase [Planctomycetota bacterium]
MDRFVIEGGARLDGAVGIRGAKNAVLPVLAASLLTDEPLRVPDAPRLVDVTTMMRLLRTLGSTAEREA